jgi:hypothetical protein
MLIDGRPGVPQDKSSGFAFATAGFKLGCAHSKGVLGLCLASGAGVQKNAARGLQLGKESVKAGSCYGLFTVAYCNDRGYGTAVDKAEAARL